MTTTVGRFAVSDDGTGRLSIDGPADYLASEHYSSVVARIASGGSAVVNYALRDGRPLAQAVAVALQTAYAGWLGMRGFAAAVRS